jgi:DnaJ domain
MDKSDGLLISEEQLSEWALGCLHMNHLGTLVQRELKPTLEHARALELSERARRRAWELFNDLLIHGANKPEGYTEGNLESNEEPNNQCLYRLLQVDREAEVGLIRQAYRYLAAIYHPDVEKTGNEEMFRRLTAAWKVLCNQERRATYDASLKASGP